MAKSEIVPFGKYKGQPVEVLQQDRDYCEWLMEQDWFRTRFQPIYTVIVNNFGQPAETPEHNQLQARFTDPAFRRRFVNHVLGQPAIDEELRGRIALLEQEIARYQKDLEAARESAGQPWRGIRQDDPDRDRKIAQDPDVRRIAKSLASDRAYLETLRHNPPETLTEAQFEVERVDVVLLYELFPRSSPRDSDAFRYRADQLDIECKPSLSDDYPAVLRQIAGRFQGYHPSMRVLLVGDGGYTGTGATLEQVKAIFNSRKVRIVFLKDLEKL